MLRTEQGVLPCERNDPALWYSSDPSNIAAAKALCHTCPRIELCLEECLALEDLLGTQLTGVHGGLTPVERTHRQMRL